MSEFPREEGRTMGIRVCVCERFRACVSVRVILLSKYNEIKHASDVNDISKEIEKN